MFSSLRTSILLVALLLLAGLHQPATAQVTEITTQDLLDLVGTNEVAQVFDTGSLDPNTNTDLNTLINATGSGQVYDLRPFNFSFRAEGLIRYRTIAEAQSLGWPGSSDSYLSQASVAFALDLRDGNGTPPSTIYSYQAIETSGPTEGDNSYGAVTDASGMLSTTTYDPPLLQYSTPLEFSPTPTTWSSTSTQTSFGMMSSITVDGTVEGYGTLRTPAGDYEVMRVRRETTLSPITSTSYEFISPVAGFTVATVEGDALGTYTVSLTAISDDFAETSIASGQTGSILSDNRLSIALSSGPNAAGQLALATYNRRPYNNTFDGTSATSDDGTSITPDVIFDEQYYLVYDVDDTLDGFTAEVCFDASTVPGVQDIQKVVLLTRDASSSAWSPLNSTVNGSAVCATVSSFSQFGMGSNSAFNALPVELSTFDVVSDNGRALLTWATLSEQSNSGFHIEHAKSDDSWSRIGFVEGAGTTDVGQSYRFRTPALDPGIHRFRLAQVDLDGTTTRSAERTVRIQPAGPARLIAPSPNPARTSATVGLVLRESSDVTIEVFDLLGRRQAIVHEGALSAGPEHRFPLDVSTWASGTYLVRVSGAGTPTHTRLTVVR
ncbi:MAG: T9SS type A sorting domain-containing protein [Bacteroidetes bacterium]|nr:T9SS type A sorting domain-containing protein [Bacteroidota bacterium]